MIYIAHRINTIRELKDIPMQYGVEIDLRDRGERIILQHDPFKDGEDLVEYLEHYRHGFMILNIKSERIEFRVRELLIKYGIKEYFFLDSSFPMIRQMVTAGESNIAVRFSEFEGMDTVMALKGQVQWIWVDCFSKLPLDRDVVMRQKEAGFKLCLVSPELQGRPLDVVPCRDRLREAGIIPDAVCSKRSLISTWEQP